MAAAGNVNITALSRTSGPTEGGTMVTITANELLATAKCKFGSLAATSSAVSSSTQMSCQTPAQPAAAYPLEITNNDQDYTTQRMMFLYYGMSFRVKTRK